MNCLLLFVHSFEIFWNIFQSFHVFFFNIFHVQATLLNSQGSPWAVRWFPVAEARLYNSAKLSSASLHTLHSSMKELSNGANGVVTKKNGSGQHESDMTIHMITVGFVGLLGLAIGRYSHQQ